MDHRKYRGRLAPSPSGLLHIGHARTFWTASQRAIANRGALILRNEDLDPQRSRGEFVRHMIQDLRWLGIRWNEGPDCGGTFGPYSQSERREHYLKAWQRLRLGGFVYPCTCSRKDLARSASAPNDTDDELLYPGTCRDRNDRIDDDMQDPAGMTWRFRVPNGATIEFTDLNLARQRYIAGHDFGDFLVWLAGRCSLLSTRGGR
jgi:glutamyl/glutaminyl-tRNA synthetase